MTREPTAELLLALCRGQLDGAARSQAVDLLAQPIDWNALAELAALHGVVGLVRRNLIALEARETVKPQAWQRMQQAANQIAFDGVIQLREIDRIVAALDSAGIEHILLKGLGLADLLYSDPVVRPSADIDLLISRVDLDLAESMLATVGYLPQSTSQQVYQREHSYHVSLYRSVLPGQSVLLELHWDLTARDLFSYDLDAWRRRAQEFTVDGVAAELRRFAPEEQLLHLALHMRKHRYVGLRWLADVAELVRRFGDELSWQYIDASARRAGLKTLLYVSLSLAQQYLAAPVPSQWLARWTPSSVRLRVLHSVVDQNALLTPVEMEDAGWTRLAPAEVLLLDRPGTMARELRYRLFPPTEKLAGFENDAAGIGKRLSLRAGRLANRTATLFRR